MPNRPTERGKSLLLQKEMNQKHCNAKTSTLNGSALSTKCRKYEKVIGRPNVISLQHTVRDSWAQRTRSESTSDDEILSQKEVWPKTTGTSDGKRELRQEHATIQPIHPKKYVYPLEREKSIGEGWPREYKMTPETHPHSEGTQEARDATKLHRIREVQDSLGARRPP